MMYTQLWSHSKEMYVAHLVQGYETSHSDIHIKCVCIYMTSAISKFQNISLLETNTVKAWFTNPSFSPFHQIFC
jgi:hypothetical protein